MAPTLVIGNKAYSSWSFRPWIAMKAAGIAFDELVIPLYQPDSKARILAHSPAGKVPSLNDGDVRVWESLAIIEYVAERYPAANLWPDDAAARAHARAVAAEMHAGFSALRRHCPMNMRRPVQRRDLPDEVRADVARIEALWSDCRARHAASGPFLFGHFTAADAMYAPVVSRFRTYAVELGHAASAYMEAMTALPAWQEWQAGALREPWILTQFEVDPPAAPRVVDT